MNNTCYVTVDENKLDKLLNCIQCCDCPYDGAGHCRNDPDKTCLEGLKEYLISNDWY